ncbi:MAG: class I SAM-dependent methyltransferase [Acidobacteriota bacterium]
MIEQILKRWKSCSYDFRRTANPGDPFGYRFDEWLSYYRLKWAIASVLRPASILEIGVRCGYSAAAFLDAAPTASYLGIDVDEESYGGHKGALEWAGKITARFQASFLKANTQQMQRLPGGIYDLVHVDGQQDGDGSFHDLMIALPQARYILVDGYFWTNLNFLAMSSFLERFREAIEFYCVIPGYAGELLIKVSPEHLTGGRPPASQLSSPALRPAYGDDYYLLHCGGYEFFKRDKGKRLEDPRLVAVASLGGLKSGGRCLDLGCGRGELVYEFARRGFQVTAVDYSEPAIALAQRCFADEPELRKNVAFLCGDACTAPLQGPFDLAIASDLIEHLAAAELDVLYGKVARLLKPDGLFIVHTFPNLWSYRYEYPRRRRFAASVGAYLPPEPRSRYELLVHINEQSPRRMRAGLGRHFANVLIWFADPAAPLGSLGAARLSKSFARFAPDLFAIASHAPVPVEQVRRLLEMTPLEPLRPGEVSLVLTQAPARAAAGQCFDCSVLVGNESGAVLQSLPPNPMHIAYHWLDEEAGRALVFDGLRTRLWPPLCHGRSMCYVVPVRAPELPGRHRLRLTLVQEGVRWFDQPPTNLYADALVLIE